MIALIVVLITVAIFALLLFAPVRIKIYAKYENSGFVCDYKVKYGFLTIKRRTEKEKTKKDKEKGEKPKRDKPKVKEVIGFIKENIKDIKRLIHDVTSYATKKLVKIEKFSVTARLGTDDAMDTALIFGTSSAFLYNSVGVLERCVRTKNIMIDYKPDFTEEKIFIEFESIIKTKIYNAFGLVLVVFLRVRPIMKRRGETKNGKSD